MSVWLTSDLHLGHRKAAECRGFSSVREHDDTILHNLSHLTKRDKLFVLGDIAWTRDGLSELAELQCTMDAVLGNHDQFSPGEYAAVFNKMYGIVKYKDFWLSHCPIHPQEMYRCVGNIHGHIHKGAGTDNIGHPYINVNVDFNELKPVRFVDIASNLEENK